MTTRRMRMAWTAAAVILAAGVAPAWAGNCWTETTTHGCAAGGWHLLQFRNNCAGGTRPINVCVKWTSGASAGVVNRLANSTAGGGSRKSSPACATTAIFRTRSVLTAAFRVVRNRRLAGADFAVTNWATPLAPTKEIDAAGRRGGSRAFGDLSSERVARGGGMGNRRPLAIRRFRLAAASVLLPAVASPALAQQNCWTDVTPNNCQSGGWHVLQFKNGCSGGEKTINVCLKWTSGVSSGVVAASPVSPTAARWRRFIPASATTAPSATTGSTTAASPTARRNSAASSPARVSSARGLRRLVRRPPSARARRRASRPAADLGSL